MGLKKIHRSKILALAMGLVVATVGTVTVRNASAEEERPNAPENVCASSAGAQGSDAIFASLCELSGGQVTLAADDGAFPEEESSGESDSITTYAGKKGGILLQVAGAKPLTAKDKTRDVDLSMGRSNAKGPMPAKIRANNFGSVNIYIPADKVRTQLSGWLAAALSVMAGVAVTIVVGGVCVAVAVPETGGAAAAGCQALATALGAGVTTYVNELLDGKSPTDPNVWAKTIAVAAVSSMGAAGWTKFEPWAKTKLIPLMKAVAGKIKLFAKTFQYWAGNKGGQAITLMGNLFEGLAPRMFGFLRSAS